MHRSLKVRPTPATTRSPGSQSTRSNGLAPDRQNQQMDTDLPSQWSKAQSRRQRLGTTARNDTAPALVASRTRHKPTRLQLHHDHVHQPASRKQDRAGAVPAVNSIRDASSMSRKCSSPSRSKNARIEQPLRRSITWSESMNAPQPPGELPPDSGLP